MISTKRSTFFRKILASVWTSTQVARYGNVSVATVHLWRTRPHNPLPSIEIANIVIYLSWEVKPWIDAWHREQSRRYTGHMRI